MKDNLLDELSDIFSKYDCYLVGGYLRNYYMNGTVSNDRDIAVLNDSKSLALDIADKIDGTFVELDCENEIYRVVSKDKINYFDISRMLNDNVLEDVKRRDFTINSIFYDLNKKEIFDPLDGISDIKNKIIRTADLKNLYDDPLRMLRMYRFIATTGFRADEELKKFCALNFDLVKKCAMERIQAEIMHIFEGEYIANTLSTMFDDGVLEKVFPFVSEIKKIPPNSHHHLDLIHHSIETVKNIRINKPLLKISAFYHDIGKPSTWTIEENGRHRFIGHDNVGSELVKNELKKLNFSTKAINYVSKMVKYHIYPATLANIEDSSKAFARFVRKIGDDTPDLIELSRADRLSAQGPDITKEMTQQALNHLENLLAYYNKVKAEVKNPKSILDGREIMEILNIKPSKKVGKTIELLIEQQLMGNIKTKEAAIKFVKELEQH